MKRKRGGEPTGQTHALKNFTSEAGSTMEILSELVKSQKNEPSGTREDRDTSKPL